MKRRTGYFLAFALLLAVEIIIALFVRDDFIRPYVGDILVTVLLCCLARAVFPKVSPALPVFILAAAVEGLQWLHLSEILGLEGTVFGVILGATADWVDLVCYGIGCLSFTGAQWLLSKKRKTGTP